MRLFIVILAALLGAGTAARAETQPQVDRTNALAAAIRPHLAAAQASLAEKTRAQNIKGIAVARAGVDVFQGALDELGRTGTIHLPEKPRRDLADAVAACAAACGAIETEFSNRLARASEAGARTAEPPGPGRDREDRASAAPLEARPDPAQAPAAPSTPEFFASRGTGDAWSVVGRWKGEMMAVAIVPVPVTGRSGREESQLANPLGGAESRQTFESVRTLPSSPAAAYRLRRVDGQEPVDVVEWPAPGNRYTLVFRTHRSATVPFVHGFELQACLGATDWAAAGVSPAPASGEAGDRTVRLSISTEPKGARAYIDDVMHRDGRGEPVRTPCVLDVPAGAHTVRLALAGYLDVAATNLDLRQDRALSWVFREDPRVIRKTLAVDAKGKWMPAGVRVAKGDRVIMRASGTWVCGSRGEECGPEGYTNDERSAHYYAGPESAPRQAPDLNYGALIVKTAEHAYPRGVGVASTFVADDEARLLFDINELADASLRRDNRGRMQVQVMVLPGGR